jgi:hypothetical protein
MSAQQKPIALGMVGGGPDSGIGSTHRIAIRIDNKCELVAGAFSRNRAKSTLMRWILDCRWDCLNTDRDQTKGPTFPGPNLVAFLDGITFLPPSARAELLLLHGPRNLRAQLSAGHDNRG